MKFSMILPVLAGAVLAAPQQQHAARDTKPFKEPPANMRNCHERDDSPTLQARPAILTEDCTGTMTYCFRQFYKLPRNNENFTSPDDCLSSRGVDPKTIDVQRILNKDDYDAGVQALQDGNQLYNRYMLIGQLSTATVPAEQDQEGNNLIAELWSSNEDRLWQARQSLDLAKWKFSTAFSPEFSEEINQAIQDARGKLSAAWADVRNADVHHLSNLGQWIHGKSEKKYYGNF